MKKEPKPAAADAFLEYLNKAIAEMRIHILRRTRELKELSKKQRTDRYVYSELMKKRADYLRLNKGGKK